MARCPTSDSKAQCRMLLPLPPLPRRGSRHRAPPSCLSPRISSKSHHIRDAVVRRRNRGKAGSSSVASAVSNGGCMLGIKTCPLQKQRGFFYQSLKPIDCAIPDAMRFNC